MGIIRDSFVIFKNWAESINALPEEYQLETYKALVDFGLTGERPQGLSPIANAMIISFSTGMENNILRYNASVENGKKGGRPKKSQVQEEIENLEKPSETQENLEKPSNNLDESKTNLDKPNHNLNVNDNVNVNVFSQSINNLNNLSMRACVREELVEKYKEYYSYWGFGEDKVVFEEVLDVLSKAICQAEMEEGLVFDREPYKKEHFDSLTAEELHKIVFYVINTPNIENRELYILGALINRAREAKQ